MDREYVIVVRNLQTDIDIDEFIYFMLDFGKIIAYLRPKSDNYVNFILPFLPQFLLLLLFFSVSLNMRRN